MPDLSQFDEYARANAPRYIAAARAIKPDLGDPEAVRGRVAFAILSANVGFPEAVKAYQYVRDAGGCHMVDHAALRKLGGFTRDRASFVRALAGRHEDLLRDSLETWDEYRCRLAHDVAGLGLCKASFAASLLYPTEVQICCLDVWMRKLYDLPVTEHSPFRPGEHKRYRACERGLAKFQANCQLPSLFLAQWIIWGALRGRFDAHDFW